jgi:integrase/recombinase XerC
MTVIVLPKPKADELHCFLNSIASEDVSNATRSAYQNDITAFFLFTGERFITSEQVKEVTVEQIEEYKNLLHQNGSKASSINRSLSAMRQFFRRMVAKGIIKVSPMELIKNFKVEPSVVGKSISREDVESMIDLASNDENPIKSVRDVALLILLVYGGLRREEASNAKWKHVIEEGGHKVLLLPKTKSQVEQYIKIAPRVYEALQACWETYPDELYDPEGYIFISLSKNQNYGKRLSPNSIRRIVVGYGKRIGLDITAHMLRHTCCTLAIEGGAKPHQVQAHLRHKNIATTMLYFDAKDQLTDNATDYI